MNQRQFDDPNSSQDCFYDSSGYSATDDTNSQFTSVSQQFRNDTDSIAFHPNRMGQVLPQYQIDRHFGLNSNKYYDERNRPFWTREKRKSRRRRRDFSLLSSTFDDTEASMALDVLTVTLNLDQQISFGMSVIPRQTNGYYAIFIHEIIPNGVIALDGRLKPGYILLEVNDIPLDTPDSIDILKMAVHQATQRNGYLKLTCSYGDARQEIATRGFFRLPDEPVRPIDPRAWVAHTNAARGFKPDHQSNPIGGHLTMMHNPSTVTTSTSGHSSPPCSSSIRPPPIDPPKNHHQQIGQIKNDKKEKTLCRGGLSCVLKRFFCIHAQQRHKK